MRPIVPGEEKLAAAIDHAERIESMTSGVDVDLCESFGRVHRPQFEVRETVAGTGEEHESVRHDHRRRDADDAVRIRDLGGAGSGGFPEIAVVIEVEDVVEL